MPSFIWKRDPHEAYSEPYEYSAQEQFAREARCLLVLLSQHYSEKNRTFTRDAESRDKAIWMLQLDSLAALEDALDTTIEKRHRIAARLFRDALETQDLSMYFAKAVPESDRDLRKWFKNEVIPHRVARDYVKRTHGDHKFEELKSLYSGLSKYTHRTYRALAMSYVLASGNRFSYDGFHRDSQSLVLPHVISFSYAVLAMLIRRFVDVSITTEQITNEKAANLWDQALESETIPRRFGSNLCRLEIPINIQGG